MPPQKLGVRAIGGSGVVGAGVVGLCARNLLDGELLLLKPRLEIMQDGSSHFRPAPNDVLIELSAWQMARWDEILTLPVQNPPTLEFSASDIMWSRVEGWRDAIDRVALIPFSRVDDFVRGESSNKDCPTRFHVEARRRRPPGMAYKPKVDGILEYILYWCSFGPDDHRKGGVVRPSRVYNLKKNKTSGRPNTKRGCVCHFIVKRLIAEPTVALIIYNQDKHIDKKGIPCHGPLDQKAVGTRAMFAPYISDDARLRVLSLLYVGVPVETIMQRHNETVEKQGGPCNRDDLLTHRYVRRLERSIRRSTYELDVDDDVSVSMWVDNHRNHIFFHEDYSNSEPFVLGIQTEWQLQQMIRFGNRSIIASDSRFGTNKLKYPVHSLLVFDSNNKAIPVAWIVTPRFANADSDKWIRALYDRVHSKDPTWKLAGFIIDDPSADILTLRRLGQMVYIICKENADFNCFEDFMEDFVDCSEFLDYFKATWVPRMGMWTTALKTLPLASQAASAAIESYHHQFKLRLMNEKDAAVYQRVDWLVDKLGTKVHSYYWLDEYSGKDDFARYQKNEWKSGLTSWQRALQIPDSDVVVEHRFAKVRSQFNSEYEHIVWNPGSEFAICECNWSRMGNLCKHAIKASQVYRDRGLAAPSMTLFNYHQILTNMLHCPPHDSLIRDHAVSLSVCAQMQLNAIIGVVNSQPSQTAIPPEDAAVNKDVPANDIFENEDNDNQCSTTNVPSDGNATTAVEVGCTDGRIPPESITQNGGKEFVDNQCTIVNISSNGNDKGVQEAGCSGTAHARGSGDDAFSNATKDDDYDNIMDIDMSSKASQSMLVEQRTAEETAHVSGVLEECSRVVVIDKQDITENSPLNGYISKVHVVCNEITDGLGDGNVAGVIASDVCGTEETVADKMMVDDINNGCARTDATQESVTGNVMDVDLPSSLSFQSGLGEQQTANEDQNSNGVLEIGGKVLAMEGQNLTKIASVDTSINKVQEAMQGGSTEDSDREKVGGVESSNGGICGNILVETCVSNAMDVDTLPSRTSPSIPVPVEQPADNSDSSTHNTLDNETLDEKVLPFIETKNALIDVHRDDSSHEFCLDQAVDVLGCDNGVCGGHAVESGSSTQAPDIPVLSNAHDSAPVEAVASG
ncbi:hypothetical protein ACLOJK_009369 [Asimina triloba]